MGIEILTWKAEPLLCTTPGDTIHGVVYVSDATWMLAP